MKFRSNFLYTFITVFTTIILITIFRFFVGTTIDSYKLEFVKESVKSYGQALHEDLDLFIYELNPEKVFDGNKVIAPAVTLLWTPQKLNLNDNWQVETTFNTRGDWYFEIPCQSCGTPARHPLHLEILSNRVFLGEKDGYNIYGKNKLSISDTEHLSDFINSGDSVYIPEIEVQKEFLEENKVDGFNNNMNQFTFNLVGSNTLAVYAKNEVNLEFQVLWRGSERIDKMDLLPKDMASLYDAEGNILVFNLKTETEIVDSGYKEGNLRLQFSSKDGLEEGLYFLRLQGSDLWNFNNIKINTNKAVLHDGANIVDSSLYTSVNSTKTLTFSTPQFNKLTIRKGNSQIGYDNINSTVELEDGEYIISTEDITSFNDYYYSDKEEHFFHPYTFDTTSNISSDFVITRLKQINDRDNKEITHSIFPVLKEDLLQLENLNSINLVLYNEWGQRYNGISNYISDYGLTKVGPDQEGHAVFKQNSLEYKDNLIKYYEPQLLPSLTQLVVKPNGYVSSQEFVLQRDTGLLGDHTFLVYGEEFIKTRFFLSNYSEQMILLSVKDIDGNKVCEEESNRNRIEANCPLDLSGWYIIEVKSTPQRDSFVINSIELNSNKLLLINKATINNNKEILAYTPYIDSIFIKSNAVESVNYRIETAHEIKEFIMNNEKTSASVVIGNGLSKISTNSTGYTEYSGTHFVLNKSDLVTISEALVDSTGYFPNHLVLDNLYTSPNSVVSFEIRKRK